MGAGVLPVSLYKGTLFLLLGQERKNNLWADFGGGAHKGERPFKTAIREGVEELNGFLGDETELEALVTSNLILSISYDKYTSYIFKTNYDKKLPLYFSNVNSFAELHLKDEIDIDDNGQIQWFPLTKLKEDKSQIKLREFYKPLLETILKNERFIISFLQTME